MKINKYKWNINKLISYYGEDEIKKGSTKLIIDFTEELSKNIKEDKPKKEIIDMIVRIEIMLDQIKEIYNLENNNLLPGKIDVSNGLVKIIELHKKAKKEKNAKNN